MKNSPNKINWNVLTIGFIVTLLILSIIVFYKSILIKTLLWLFVTFYCLILSFILCLWACIKFRKKKYLDEKFKNILIIVPHQDDCVTIAGGIAIQTLRQQGKVHILYMTNGEPDDQTTRMREAVKAWDIAGLDAKNLIFMNHYNLTGFIQTDEIREGIIEIEKYINQFDPDAIFIPLYDGGHYQHDIINFMVSQGINNIKYTGKVFESPLYNFYFSFLLTPERILSGLLRFVPFINHSYPPEPIDRLPLFYLNMSTEELEMKRKMLSCFLSQEPDDLVERFGFIDRYQVFKGHDYSKPPFDYDHSFARFINWLKKQSIVGTVVSKSIVWTKTIHPDPDYQITKIPKII